MKTKSRDFFSFVTAFCLLSGALAPMAVEAGADKKLVEIDSHSRKLSEKERIQAQEDAILQAKRKEEERIRRQAEYAAEAKAAAEAARKEKIAMIKHKRIERAQKIRDLELAKRNLKFVKQLSQVDTTSCNFWCKLKKVFN